jgi:hypothetical protein
LSIFEDVDIFKGSVLKELRPGIGLRPAFVPSISSVSVIKNTNIRLVFRKGMGLRRIWLKLRVNRRSIPMADELISKLKGIIVFSQDGKHGRGMAIPVAVDSGKGFTLTKRNSRISRHVKYLLKRSYKN